VHQRLGRSDDSVRDDKLFDILERAASGSPALKTMRDLVKETLGISTRTEDHEIILDVPPNASHVGSVQVLPEGHDKPASPGPILSAIEQNFNGYARKARIFVHPKYMEGRDVTETSTEMLKQLTKAFNL
jgi:hypothetical protein